MEDPVIEGIVFFSMIGLFIYFFIKKVWDMPKWLKLFLRCFEKWYYLCMDKKGLKMRDIIHMLMFCAGWASIVSQCCDYEDRKAIENSVYEVESAKFDYNGYKLKSVMNYMDKNFDSEHYSIIEADSLLFDSYGEHSEALRIQTLEDTYALYMWNDSGIIVVSMIFSKDENTIGDIREDCWNVIDNNIILSEDIGIISTKEWDFFYGIEGDYHYFKFCSNSNKIINAYNNLSFG